LEAQQHKKYAQTTPLDDGVSSLFVIIFQNIQNNKCKKKIMAFISKLTFPSRKMSKIRDGIFFLFLEICEFFSINLAK
jgi:hypothetical protein